MSRHPALPISLYLRGPVLLVGDTPGAAERRERLRAAGADVTQVGPDGFAPDMCAGKRMVVVHADAATQERVARAARAAGCLTYAHDRPELSDFAMPALVRRGPLKLAISTDAAAPALARRLRVELERLLETAGDALDHLLGELEARRASMQRGDPRKSSLYRAASRLRIVGRVEIDGDEP